MDRQGRDRKSKKGYTIKSMITKIIALILVFTFVFGSSFMQPLSSTADDNMAVAEQTGAIEQETQESAEPETVLPLPEETQPESSENAAEESVPEETYSEPITDTPTETSVDPGDAVDVSQHPLVEVEASDDEPLLSEGELNEQTLILLNGGVPSARRQLKSAGKRKALLAANDSGSDIPTEGPVADDGKIIEWVTVEWLSKSTGSEEPAGKGTLELKTDSNIVGNQQFEINFALSGTDDHEPGSVEIIFPAYLWHDRYGNEPGNLTLSVPEEPGAGAEFAWRRVGDNIIITNLRRLSAASKVMIQGTFRNVNPYDMVDIDVAENSEYANADNTGRSNPFNVVIGISTPNDKYVALRSNTIDATIDTHVNAASATKSAYNTSSRSYYVYHTLEKATAINGGNMPQEFVQAMQAKGLDPEEYSFARWYVSGSATGSQPFYMTVNDSYNGTIIHYKDAQHQDSETLEVEGMMLGAQGALVWDEESGSYKSGNVLSTDGQNITATIYDGYNTLPKSAYIWTAYKKADFPVEGDEYRISNSQTVEVTGWDDMITTIKTADAEAPFRLPVTYHVKKVWNDQGHEERRPKHQSVLVYYNENLNTLDKKQITEDNDWTITWDDEGQGWQYKVRELGMYGNGWETGHEEDDAYLKDGSDYSYSRYNPNFMQVGNDEFSHIINRVYDEDGDLKEYDRWWYELEKEEYDSETHTWIKYNKYCEEHVVRQIVPFKEQKLEVGIQKNRLNYGDSSLMSTSDRALNILRRGDDVIVGYNVYGYGYIMELTKGQDVQDVDITSFGFRDVTLELEDNYGEDTLKDTKNNTFLLDSNIRLTPEDAEIAYVNLATPSYYQYYQADKYSAWTFRTLTANDFGDFDRPNEELWGLKDGEWIRLAVVSITGNGAVSVTTENGASNTGSNKMYINMPAGIWKVKTVMTIPGLKDHDPETLDRRIDGARMSYSIGVRLLGQSETIQNRLNALFEANDYAMCTLDNYATLNAYEDNGTFATSLDDQSRTWLHGRNHRVAVRQEKSFELVENDLNKKVLKLHSKVTTTQQSNILEQNEYWEAREEGLIPSTESGTWYDLLPLGVMPDVDSVKLTNGEDTITDVYTIPNYKESGRVMLVVKTEVKPHVSYTNRYDPNPYSRDITYPKEGYKDVHTFEFDAYYSWDQARLYGIGSNVRNVAAYEADENALGNINGWSGEPDDPTKNKNQRAMNAVGDDKTLMTGLDPERPEGHTAFVYSGSVLKHEEIDFQAATELRKYVTKDGLGLWTTGRENTPQVSLYEGDYYTYMLYVASDSNTTTKNIILLDNLETYVPTEVDTEDYGRKSWQGYFDSVDVSDMVALGIEPVIYYNTSDVDLDSLKGDTDSQQAVVDDPDRVINYLKDPKNGWTTVKPADPKTVRAIAVDARYKTDGSDFEVPPKESIFCTVRMRARVYETSGEETDPFNEDSEKRKSAENNDYAFNNVYLGCTQVDPVKQETHAIINHNYVRVGILPFELKVTKVWDDADNTDGKRPNSITVHLLANGKRMDPDRTITLSNANEWTGTFAHVIRYDDEGNWITYSFEEESADPNPAFNLEGYTQTTDRKGENVTLTNTHIPEKTQISFEKVWDDDDNANGERPDSITVRLMADGKFTGKTVIVKPDRTGNWVGGFSDLPKYSNPEGLSGRQHEIQYTVEEEPIYKYIDTYETDEETGKIIINNEYYPFGSLQVKKVIENYTDESQDKEFTFTLILKDQEGNDVTEKYGAFKSSDSSKLYMLGNGDTFTLKGDEYMTIADIPSETKYEVVESETAGYTQISSSNASGSIRAGGTVIYSSFTNRYEASGSQTISLFKTLSGRTMSRYQFRFELVDKTDGSKTKDEVIRTASADADGNALFSRLLYTEADHGKTFTYQIREVDREKPGYTYDKNTYTVEVTVTDNGDGTMTCTPVYKNAAGEVIDNPENHENGIVFHNEYHASGNIALKAWKQLPDGELKEYLPFEFELLKVDTDPDSDTYKQGSKVQTKACDDLGTIAFDALNFTEQDVGKTFFYVIREKKGGDARVVYDGTLRGIELSVADNGDGTLAITQTNVTVTAAQLEDVTTYEKGAETTDLPVFVNHLEPGDLSVTKLTNWDEKEPDGNATFPFTLTLMADELPSEITVALSDGDTRQKEYRADNAPTPLTEEEKAEKTVALTITSPENVTPMTGVYEFSLKAGQTLNVKDLPAGIAYQFQEAIPSGWTLTFENVAGVIVPQATQAATYTNKFEPGKAVATVLASKRLDGRAPEAQKFAFELVDDTEGSDTKGQVLQTLWNHASGYVLFDLNYDTAGEYHYILREVQGLIKSVDSEGNITYVTDEDELRKIAFDEKEYGVTVTVTEQDQDGNKTLTANVVYDENDGAPPQFNNATRPGSLQISKVGNGLTDANKNKEFTFKVTLSNDAGMPLTESGNMIWYAQPSDTKSDVAPVPETPDQPVNSEREPVEQPQVVVNPNTANAAPFRKLAAGNKQLISAPALKAAGAPTTSEYYSNTSYGNLSNTVKWALYKDGTLIIEPIDGVYGSFAGNGTTSSSSSYWPWLSYKDQIKKCYVNGHIDVTDGIAYMFYYANNLTYADLSGLYTTTSVKSVYHVFDCAWNLEYLDIRNISVGANCSNWNMCLDWRGGDSGTAGAHLNVVIFGPGWEHYSGLGGYNWRHVETNEVVERVYSLTGQALAGTWLKSGYNPSFTIAFDPNGATGSMDPIPANLANPPTLPKCTFESDLNFVGWSTDPNAILPEYADEATFTGAAAGGQTVTLYAIWMSEDSFLLNFDANGGYSRVQWQRVNGPTATVEMPVPTHPNNYEFLYWTTQQDGGGDRYSGTVTGADFDATPGSTIKLYAQYMDPSRRAKVTVEHYQQNADLQGYTLSGTDQLGVFDLGAKVIPEKKAYTGFIPPTEFKVLVGFDTSETTQEDGSEVTVVKGGVTIRYYYDRTKYKLAFDANTGEGTMPDMDMIGGVPAKLPVNQFTKENALFVGWNTAADGSGINYGDGQSVNSIGKNGDVVTLYAQWFDIDDAETAEPTNGEYIVHCKANETIVFPTLPAGTHYTIEEINLPDGWTLNGIENKAGTVLSAERVNVTATNTYAAVGYADIIAHKALPGETISQGQFTFELLDENDQVLQTKANSPVDTMEQTYDSDGKPIPNSYYGTAPVLFDTITYNQQGIYKYKIRERVGTDTAISYDEHVENVTVVVKDRGDGRLVTEVLYDESGANFRNDMSPGNLKVSKTVHNASEMSADKSFSFTIYLFDSSGNEIQTEYPVKLSNGTETTVKSGGAVSIKGSESFTVEGLPHQSKYIVVEVPTAGFELVKEEGNEGNIQAGQTAEATFENAYSSRTDAPGGLGAEIEARKVFENGIIQPEQFKFRLSNSSDEEIETVYAEPDGSVTFSALHYTLEDNGKRFVYYVEEIPGEDSGIVYDTHKERVSVEVKDNGDGTMTAEVTYDGETEEEAKQPPVFTNQKKGKTISITKKLAQKDSAANAAHKAEKDLEFGFIVYEGEPIEDLSKADTLSNEMIAELLAERKFLYVPVTVKKGQSEATADIWGNGHAYKYDADSDSFVEDPDTPWEWIFDENYNVIELPSGDEDYKLKQIQIDQETFTVNNQSFVNVLDVDNPLTITNEYQKEEPPTPGDGSDTGDHTRTLPFILMMAGAGALIAIMVFVKRRRSKKSKS